MEDGARRKALTFIGVGFEVSGTVVGSAVLGWLIDRWLGTLPVFTVAVVVLGGVGAFWRLYVRLRKSMEGPKGDDGKSGDGP